MWWIFGEKGELQDEHFSISDWAASQVGLFCFYLEAQHVRKC
jgi:hypothetical protein